VLAAVDSKRAERYFQLFDSDLAPLGAPVAMTPEDFASQLAPRAVALAGDTVVATALAARGIDVQSTSIRHPDAAVVARLAAKRDHGEALTPFYLPPAAVTHAAPRGAAARTESVT